MTKIVEPFLSFLPETIQQNYLLFKIALIIQHGTEIDFEHEVAPSLEHLQGLANKSGRRLTWRNPILDPYNNDTMNLKSWLTKFEVFCLLKKVYSEDQKADLLLAISFVSIMEFCHVSRTRLS